MAAEVGREDAVALREPLLGQAPEPEPVRGDAVEADDGWRLPISPLVQVQPHSA